MTISKKDLEKMTEGLGEGVKNLVDKILKSAAEVSFKIYFQELMKKY